MHKSYTYCVFCKKGLEKEIAGYFNTLHSDLYAIAPTKEIYEKRNNKWLSKEVSLIPNYVFIYAKTRVNIGEITRLSNAYRPLQYEYGQSELTGGDLEYAMWLHRNHGKIRASKYICEGTTIKVVEGPLIEKIGKISKVDKHKRRIWVSFDFDGQTRVVVLSAECITPV